MVAWLDGILRQELVATAEELEVVGYTEVERSLAIGIEVRILAPVGNLRTSRTRLLPVVHVAQPLAVSQLSAHHHLHVGIGERRHHDSHITIHTSYDVVHVNRLVDAHQERLQTAVALHHRQELLTIHIHEDTSESIGWHRLDILSLDRAVSFLCLLERIVYILVERESLAVDEEHAVLHTHVGGNDHLRRVGVLRSTEGERSHKLLWQSLSLSHHRHRGIDLRQTFEHRRRSDAHVLVGLEILHHLLLQLRLGISHNWSHHEESLVGEAYEPRVFQYGEMKALTFCQRGADMLLSQRSEPIGNIAVVLYLGTKSEVAIGTFEEIDAFRNIETTLRGIVHMEQRLKHGSLVARMILLSHLRHINRDDSRTFHWDCIEIITATTRA